MGALKYLNGLTGMPADSNLRKLYCNENLAWGKQEPLIHPYMFWYATKGEKVVKISFYFIYL